MKRNGIGRIIAGCTFIILSIAATLVLSLIPGLYYEQRVGFISIALYLCIPPAVLFLVFGSRCYRNASKITKTDYRREMRECLMEHMLSYINDNPFAADAVVPIFSDAELMIRRLPEKEIAKTIRVNSINVECCALNILQNVAMTQIKQVSTRDFLADEDLAYELFTHINQLKLDKGYIDKQQYDDNQHVATKLAIKSPFGTWL